VPGTGTIQLARVLGIRIGVSRSWFVVLFLFIWVLSDYFQEVLGGGDGESYAVAVASALLFFGSIILHELGHALQARREGIEIAGIDLWFFGGIAQIKSETQSPGAEFRVAIAGPIVTLLVVGLCVALGALLADMGRFIDVALLESGTRASAALVLLSWLAMINAALLVFNLVPAFPLDGGRIARAAAWKLTGDRHGATRAAARLGQAFGYLLVGFGIWLTLMGAVGSGLWLLVLGVFLSSAARRTVLQTALSERLEGVTVADIMDREPPSLAAETRLLEAEEEFGRLEVPALPVVEADGRFLGLLRRERLEEHMAAGRPALSAREALDDDAGELRIAQDQTLEALLGSEGLRRMGAIAAVDRDGRLCGLVTFDQVRHALSPVDTAALRTTP
jgi:Zn-dependent protease